MKHISRSKKSFLWQAVLASTFFGGFPLAAHAVLAPINSNTTTALTPGPNGYDFTANNVTLSVTDGYIIGQTGGTSVDNNSTGAAKIATNLIFLGDSTVQGTIGPTNAVSSISLRGINKTVQFDGDIKLSTGITLEGVATDGTIIFADGVDVTGFVNNLAGDSKGEIDFVGSGSVSGSIGSSNAFNLLSINSSAAGGKAVTFSGNTVSAAEIDVFGATTTLKLDNALMRLTTINGINTDVAGANTLDINQALLINGDIGSLAKAFSLVKVGALGDTTINGDIFATTTQFQGANKLSLTDGSDVIGTIDSTVLNQGILELRGDHTITGTIGAGNALNTINVTGIGKTVNFNKSVSSGFVNIAPSATCATTINFGDNADVTGNIDNTTGADNAGTLNFLGSSVISGTIGATNSICQVNLKGGAGEIVQFGDDVNVGTGNINFATGSATTSELQIMGGSNITGNIDNTTGSNGIGTLTFLGDSNMNGTIGATNSLFLVNLDGAAGKTVNFTQNINAQTVTFTDDGKATLASGITVSGPITTTGNPQGNLVFLGDFTVNNPIGTLANPLTSITANGPLGTTVSQFEDMFATNINVNNGGALSVLDSNLTLGGNVNLTANSTLAVAAIAAPLTISDDLNIAGGSTLEISLNRDPSLTYINVAQNLNINPGAFLELTNVPTFQSGHYEITIVDANGGASTAPTTVGDSLLVNFSSRIVASDLILDMDVSAASVFADQINTRGVAGALDAMAGKNFLGSLQDLLNQLPYFTSEAQLNEALAALAPIVDGSFTQETFAAQLLGYGAVSDRIRHLRQQRMIPSAKPPFPSGLSYGDDCDENGHGRWFKLYGQYADQGYRESVAGYNSETWGVAIGSDVSLNDLNLVGVSANLSHTYVGHDVSESTSSIYSLQAAIYGEQDFCDWWYFNWVTSVAYNKYTTERNFVFGLLPLSPQADFNGWQFGAKGELGYEYIYNGYHIIPNTSLYYSHLALSGYNESGAGTASQSVDAQYYNMLKAGMGVRAAYHCPYNMGDRRSIIFQPEVRMNVFYDFINDNMATTSNFTGGGPSFATIGATPAATSVNLGASLSIYSDFTNYVVTLSYDYEGKPDYNANAGYLRLRYEW